MRSIKVLQVQTALTLLFLLFLAITGEIFPPHLAPLLLLGTGVYAFIFITLPLNRGVILFLTGAVLEGAYLLGLSFWASPLFITLSASLWVSFEGRSFSFPARGILQGILGLAGFLLYLFFPGGTEFPGGNPAEASGILFLGTAALIPGWMGSVVLRRERERGDEARESLRNKNLLLSTLAHEIRTPLTVIRSGVGILQEQRPGPLNETQSRFLESVSGNIQRLMTLSDNIISSIKVESSFFRLNRELKDVRPILRNTVTVMQPFLKERGIIISCNHPNLLSRAVMDQQWTQQVLINLVHNAGKHLAPGGKIVLSALENEQFLVVRVQDNGRGINDANKKRIFDPFYQGDNITENHFDGAGLGLSIVKKIVQHQGGEIYVGSMENLGTSVAFTLPKKEAFQSEAADIDS